MTQKDLVIISVIAVTGNHADKVMLTTNLPNPLFPFTGNAVFDLDVAKGAGAQFVRDHFGIEPEVINK